MTGQVSFESSAQSIAFAPLKVLDTTDAERRQLNQRVEWMKADNDEIIRQRNIQAQEMQNQARLNQVFAKQDLEALSGMSQTISKTLIERQKRKDQEAEAEGESLAYQEGVTPESMATYKAGEMELNAADGVIQQAGDELEKSGAPFEVVSQVRGLSGKKLLGYQKGKAKLAAMQFQTWLPDQLENDNETQINIDGVTFTPATAVGSAQKQAAAEVLRQKFMAANGMLGLKPEFLNETIWPTMRSTVGKSVGEYTSRYQKETQEKEQGDAISNLSLNVADDPTAFTEAVNTLRRSGLSSSQAIDKSMDVLQEMLKNGKLTEEQYLAVKSSIGYDGKTPWGELRAQNWIDAERRARDVADAEYERDQRQLSREQKEWSNQAMQTIISDPNITNAEVQDLIDKSEEAFGSVDPRLKDALRNRTFEARSEREQRAVLDSLVSNNRLTVAELTSGKYSGDVVKSYMTMAQQQDNARAPELKEPIATSGKALESALKSKLGLVGVGDLSHHSFGYALESAKGRVATRASQIALSNGGDYADAYRQATLEVIGKIEKGQEGFAVTIDAKTGVSQFPSYSVAAVDADGSRRISSINSQVKGGGMAVVRTRELMTKEELQSAATGNIPPVAQLIATATGGKMNQFEVIDAQRNLQGLPPIGPRYTINGPDRLGNPEVNRLLNYQPTGPQVRRAYALAGGNEWKPVLEIISRAESTGGSYDSVYGGSRAGLSQMTIAQADAFQVEHARRTGSAASGRYQFMNIREQAAAAGIGPNELFSPENQDKMAIALITKKRGVSLDMIRNNPAEALRRLAPEWAGLPKDMSGLSHYHGDGRNKATVGYSDVLAAFRQTQRPSRYPEHLNPRVAYIIGNRGYGSTGPHLDVKPVMMGTTKTDARRAIKAHELDAFVDVKVGGKLKPLSKGTTTTDDERKHRLRGSHGHDFAAPDGTQVFLKNGARVVSSFKGDGGTDHTIIELPDGRRYQFLHGVKA